MKISTDLWFEKALAKAESVVQDPEDRKLLNPETYDLIHAIDYPHMGASGIFGDYVEVEAFQKLADRFLLACELIKTMESNSPETPDSSPRDCDTCRHWGGWSKNCGFCHNRSKWEGRSAPEPRPTEEPNDCSTCRWEQRAMLCCDCRDYARWEPKATSKDTLQVSDSIEKLIYDWSVDHAEEWEGVLDMTDLAARLRSQLAQKDEGLRKALVYLSEHLRHLRARNDPKALSLTNDLAAIRAALRSQLARKDEGMRETMNRLADKWDSECGRESFAPVFAEELRAALREPDGRKGE